MISKKNVVSMLMLGGALGLTVVGMQSNARATGGSSLDGSWRVTASFVDPMGTAIDAHALATFNYDGTVLETPADNHTVSDGHGAWESAGNRGYGVKVVYFRRDAAGVPIGTTEVQSWIRVNSSGHWFNGRFRAHQLDLDGKVLLSYDGLVQGSRITVD